jgi:LPS-assembly protein
VSSVLDGESVADGEVELRRGGLQLTADHLRYLQPSQLAIAQGHVSCAARATATPARPPSCTWTPMPAPSPSRPSSSAGPRRGTASRIDFDNPQRLHAYDASYSSCKPEDGSEPDWVLRMDQLDLDFDQNEGRAQGAVLHFLGVPILAAPVMTFPATSAAKSGLLPPTISIDSRGGFSIAQPYYWRLAPNYDLTLGPIVSTRRTRRCRASSATCWGQRRRHHRGPLPALRPHRRPPALLGRGRALHRCRRRPALRMVLPGCLGRPLLEGLLRHAAQPDAAPAVAVGRASKQWELDRGDVTLYAGVQGWRTLQDVDNPITVPYERAPQLGCT